MYEAKTRPTGISFTAYLGDIEDPERRRDCRTLARLMTQLTGCKPTMWGTSIVGFDAYHYRYASGHEGDCCVVGFSSRKGDISIYLLAGYKAAETRELLSRLGRHKVGKACLYVRRLSDIELPVLEKLIANSVDEIRRRYPSSDD